MVTAAKDLRKTFPTLVRDLAPNKGYTLAGWLDTKPVVSHDDDWLFSAFGVDPAPALTAA
jgi:hypothetical protein